MQPADYQAFAQALCDSALPAPSGLQLPPGIDAGGRFAIYRNNIHVSLIDALADRFPVVLALVGEEFFRAMARIYMLQHKPTSAMLAAYGDEFADFIGSHERAASLPFLSDVARLECAWSLSWAAADEPAVDRSCLAQFDATQLAAACIRPHAATQLLRSAWPVADLWQAHQQPGPDLSRISWQPQNVLITRPAAQIQLHSLDADTAAIAAALLSGQTIAAAALTGTTDIGAALGLLLDCGMIAEVLA
jgi:hypothetical protein